MRRLLVLLLQIASFLVLCSSQSTFFNSMPGTFVLSSVDDQIRSAVDEQALPWPGFRRPNKTRPLYGVTYFPWRTVVDCSNISADDVESDIRRISEIAGSIYVNELFCDFGPLLINLTRTYDMSILIGLPLTNEDEFYRQRQVLRDILTDPEQNLTHVVAISVGHNELGSIVNQPNASELVGGVIEKLSNITGMVDLSSYPDIPVTITDATEYLFRLNIFKHAQIYIGSSNTMDTPKNASQAASFIYEGLFTIRYSDPEQSDISSGKPIILTDIGWASGGIYQANPPRLTRPNIRPPPLTLSRPPGSRINASEQLDFLYYMHCPQLPLPPMYYLHSAFDLTWKFPQNDSMAYWGLGDAVTREWKPHVLARLTIDCNTGPPRPDADGNFLPSKPQTIFIIIVVVLGVIFIGMCVLVCLFWRWKRDAVRKLKRTQDQQLEYLRNCSQTSGATGDTESRYVKDVTKFNARWDDYLNMLEPDYEDLSYMVAPELRIDLSNLELKEIVGEVGARNVHQFLMEGIKMQKFIHPNVLNLIGISFTPTNMPMIITPYLNGGDVLDYIRKPEHKNIPLRQALSFCHQIAEGMRYLHELKMIHRDLAARNCMLDRDLVVKIADFGLCRDISDNDSYQTTKAFELPIRWMPPEAIEKLQWTSRSDVWSFGVVMWELFSLGQQPYSEVALIELRAYLKTGGRLSKPEECPSIVYEIMQACWTARASSRPDFADLCHCLSILLRALDEYKDIDTQALRDAIVPIVTSHQSIHNEQDLSSPPQTPSSPISVGNPVSSSMDKHNKRTSFFSRNIFTWTMPKRAPFRDRKNSVP